MRQPLFEIAIIAGLLSSSDESKYTTIISYILQRRTDRGLSGIACHEFCNCIDELVSPDARELVLLRRILSKIPGKRTVLSRLSVPYFLDISRSKCPARTIILIDDSAGF